MKKLWRLFQQSTAQRHTFRPEKENGADKASTTGCLAGNELEKHRFRLRD
ncbi:hypothetical protein ACFPTO_03855 [Paraburkholderia denitrificans]|uniref:Uncharacterized protein n=1 Tax=Paraburkholderia denitrificans TaxID=694025 RepID=A0ABW0J4K2_9BURK